MNQLFQGLIVTAAVSFAAAAVLTPLVARLAVQRGWLDRPDRVRKRHPFPVPTVGGVAVFVAFVIAMAQRPLVGEEAVDWLGFDVPLVLASLAVMLVGVADDSRGVSPRTKLLVQTAAALFLFFNGFQVERVSNPFGPAFELGMWSLPVTLLWMVGMSNAFNLIDGMDGLAAGLALVSTLGLLAAAAHNGRPDTALVAAALAGALLGFLPYNFNPARVFLGDCGALPVGFILAAIAVKSSIKASAAIAVAVPLLALGLPILDVGLAVVRRFVRRQPLFEGDRDHIHHRLLEMGLTPRRAVVTLYAVAVLFTALALAVTMGPRNVVWAALAVALLVVGLGVRALGYWEVTEIQKSFLSRLTAGLRASGDAAIRGLQHDLKEEDDLARAWHQLCATVWELELTELHFVPKEWEATRLPELHSWVPPERSLESGGPVRDAMWSFEVMAEGEVVAEVVTHRVLGRLDFDPMGLVTLFEGLTARHLARVEEGTAPPGGAEAPRADQARREQEGIRAGKAVS